MNPAFLNSVRSWLVIGLGFYFLFFFLSAAGLLFISIFSGNSGEPIIPLSVALMTYLPAAVICIRKKKSAAMLVPVFGLTLWVWLALWDYHLILSNFSEIDPTSLRSDAVSDAITNAVEPVVATVIVWANRDMLVD